MEHTPTPWKVNTNAEYAFAATITDENGGVLIAKTSGLDTFHDNQNCDEENANARRIVACVNACDGISTEMLEIGNGIWRKSIEQAEKTDAEFRALMEENARLRDALKEIADDTESMFAYDIGFLDGSFPLGKHEPIDMLDWLKKARVALNKTEQKTT